MTKVKNEVFIGLLHKKFYLIERKLTFGGGANWVGWGGGGGGWRS